MNDIKLIVAKNIAQLRQAHGMTQLALAERLNYSDKAVSKWERGESLPDITVLMEIADIFRVPLDYLVRAEHPRKAEQENEKSFAITRRNYALITGVSMLSIWLIALFVFVILTLVNQKAENAWLSFIVAVPATFILWLVLNSVWFSRKKNYFIISLIMWSVLALIHIAFLTAGRNLWLLYLLGLPGQIIILLTSFIRRAKPI